MPSEESQEIFNKHSTNHKEMTLHPTMNCNTSSSSSSTVATIHNPPSKIEKRRGRPPKITSPLSYPVKWQFMKEEGDVHVSKKLSKRNRYHNDISIVNCYEMFKEGASPSRTESPSCSSSTSSLAQTNSPSSSISQQTRTPNFQLTESSNMLTSQPFPPPTATMLNHFNATTAPSSQFNPMMMNNQPSNNSINSINNFNNNHHINTINYGSSRLNGPVYYSEPPSHESYFLNNVSQGQQTFNSSLPHPQQPPLVMMPSSYPMPINNNNITPQCTVPQQQHHFPSPIQTSQFSTPKKQVSISPKSTPSPSASVYHSWKVDLSPSSTPYQKHGELSFSLNDTIQVNSNNYKVSMTSKKPSPSSSTSSCKISPPKFTNQITTSIVTNQPSLNSNTISEKVHSPPSNSPSIIIQNNYIEEFPASKTVVSTPVSSSEPSSSSQEISSSSSPNPKTQRRSMPSLKDILN